MDFQYLFELVCGGIVKGSIYALIALGYTMVYGIIQLINFAHGEVYMIGAFVANYIFNINVMIVIIVCIMIGLLYSMKGVQS